MSSAPISGKESLLKAFRRARRWNDRNPLSSVSVQVMANQRSPHSAKEIAGLTSAVHQRRVRAAIRRRQPRFLSRWPLGQHSILLACRPERAVQSESPILEQCEGHEPNARSLRNYPNLLRERDLSLRTLARMVGVGDDHLSRVLRGARSKRVTGELASRVALALGLPDDYFPETRLEFIASNLARSPGAKGSGLRRTATNPELETDLGQPHTED